MRIGLGKRECVRFALVGICALMLVVPLSSLPAAAGPKITLETRSTWDADMINSDTSGYTGEGVYVAVLDTGLAPNWRDYFPADRIMTDLGKGFKEDLKWDSKTRTFYESGKVYEVSWIGDLGATHGTHVTSTILGYNYYAPADALEGYPLSPVFVDGIAPDVKVIPVKVLADYTIGKSKTDPIDYPDQKFVMGTDRAVAAGIVYATDLKLAGYSPMIVTMSLGGPTQAPVLEEAINYAIENGVIVVASAGNEGDEGMGYPGAYPQVISVGACGWKYEWYGSDYLAPPPRCRIWWLQDPTYGFNDIPEDTSALVDEVYITEWSSREKEGQQLDVVAPGSWVRGPYPGYPGYSHLPWWSPGLGWLMGWNPGNYYYVGGTSMSAPHVTGVAALMLEKDPTLNQAQIESILTGTALCIPAGSMMIFDLSPVMDWYEYSWGADATGAGLIQADAALAAIP
ncbi:MAG: S8 family serine peptidase [Candidatus Thermoplasmatota archaeon]|nr:S8 family serine peptidase [Candidatus Thermoplasmatota archaeon]